MKKNIFIATVLFSSTLLTLNSCKKKTEVDNETQSVVDNALCEQQFMAIAPNTNGKTVDPKSPCFKVTSTCGQGDWLYPNISGSGLDTLVDGDGKYTYSIIPTFTIDYSSLSCGDGEKDIDGIKKRGKIFIKSTHMWSKITAATNPSVVATATVSFENYTVDGVKYEGNVIITKTSDQLTTQVIGGRCTGNGWVIPNYNCTKTLKRSADGSFYSITGNSNGTNREGRDFEVKITSALIKKKSYKYIIGGSLELTPKDFKVRTVNFGDGVKEDNKATFTVNGQTVEFEMK